MASNSKLYRIGLRLKHSENDLPCPVQYFAFGGVTFHQHTEKVSGFGASTRRERVQGGYASLTDEQKSALLSELDSVRVQFLSLNPDGSPKVTVDDTLDPPREFVRARLVKTNVAGFIPRETDLKLHGWLFMQPCEAAELEFSDPPAIEDPAALSTHDRSRDVEPTAKSRKS